jgi:hypothetical protein
MARSEASAGARPTARRRWAGLWTLAFLACARVAEAASGIADNAVAALLPKGEPVLLELGRGSPGAMPVSPQQP